MTDKAKRNAAGLAAGETFGLLITEKRDGNFYHILAYVVRVLATGQIRNFSCDDFAYQDLYATSQGTNDARDRGLYAWEVEYKPYTVGLRLAALMAKTLASIDKRMRVSAETYGRPVTFGTYLAHFAAAIGATTFLTLKNNGRAGWDYDSTDYARFDIAIGAGVVDAMVTAWQAAGRPDEPECRNTLTFDGSTPAGLDAGSGSTPAAAAVDK